MRHRYRICWRSLLTGAQGQVDAAFTEERDAERVASAMDNEWAGTVTHWVESVP